MLVECCPSLIVRAHCVFQQIHGVSYSCYYRREIFSEVIYQLLRVIVVGLDYVNQVQYIAECKPVSGGLMSTAVIDVGGGARTETR